MLTNEKFLWKLFAHSTAKNKLDSIQCDPNKRLVLSTSELENFIGIASMTFIYGLQKTRTFTKLCAKELYQCGTPKMRI